VNKNQHSRAAEILALEESQTFDRKSINIAPKDLSSHVCAFANADGGVIAIGISDRSKRIEGVDDYQKEVNELLRVPMDFCTPTVPFIHELVECIDYKGHKNHILLLHIGASAFIHETQTRDAYMRVGDKTKLLAFEDRMTLTFDKGLRSFEEFSVPDADYDDIDEAYLKEYLQMIGYRKPPRDYLLNNKNFAKKQDGKLKPSVAAILLFGKYPQRFFPRARVRFIRYEGKEERTGAQMNVIKDVTFEGRILQQIQSAVDYIQTQIKERTYLTSGGIFTTEMEYPEFVRTELVVNAVTHRDYSITGTEIQIKMFDDHLVVESPGNLPKMVKIEKIRESHFARNSRIAEYLKTYKYVKDFGEGVDRMCREMEESGLPKPEFKQVSFILKATVKNVDFEGGKVVFEQEKVDFQQEKAGFTQQKVVFDSIIDQSNYNSTSKKHMKAIILDAEFNQILGARYVEKLLGCSKTSAINLLHKLRNLNLIEPVAGKGKGKYILSNSLKQAPNSSSQNNNT